MIVSILHFIESLYDHPFIAHLEKIYKLFEHAKRFSSLHLGHFATEVRVDSPEAGHKSAVKKSI